jgi:hypothetical protein
MEYHKTDMGLNNNKDWKREINTNWEDSNLKIDAENFNDYYFLNIAKNISDKINSKLRGH